MHIPGGDRGSARCVENGGMQYGLGAIDVINKTLHTASIGKILFLVGALVEQADAHAVVEEGKLAQALGKDIVVEFDGAKNFFVGEELDFRAAFFRRTEIFHR